MNTALMLLRDNAPVIGLLFAAAWAIWKVTCWTNSVDTRLQLQAQNIDRLGKNIQTLTNKVQDLTNTVQTLTNGLIRLEARVDALCEKVDGLANGLSRLEARFDALSEKVDGLQHIVHGHS